MPKQLPSSCVFCGKIEKVWSGMEHHLLTHIQEKTAFCRLCNAEFSTKSALGTHLKAHLTEKFQYKICHAIRHSAKRLSAHTDFRHPTPVSCLLCAKVFASKMLLKNHSMTHSMEKKYPCHKCGVSFKIKGYWYTHMKSVHDKVRPQKCEICNLTFASTSQKHSHMRLHTGEKPLSCDICGKPFSLNLQLKIHLLTHTISKRVRVSCDKCEKTFKTTFQLKTHIRRIHSDKPKKECPICGQLFTGVIILRSHLIVHTNEMPFQCRHCVKRFRSQSGKTSHELTNIVGKHLKCSVCPSEFRTNASLMEHRRRHNNVKPFVCLFCDQGYVRRGTLQYHMRNHTGGKPFFCKVCQIEIQEQSELARHRRVTGHAIFMRQKK